MNLDWLISPGSFWFACERLDKDNPNASITDVNVRIRCAKVGMQRENDEFASEIRNSNEVEMGLKSRAEGTKVYGVI